MLLYFQSCTGNLHRRSVSNSYYILTIKCIRLIINLSNILDIGGTFEVLFPNLYKDTG